MSSSKNQRSIWKGGKEPDALDLKQVFNACADDLKFFPELHIYQDLVGDIVVEAIGGLQAPYAKVVPLSVWRKWRPYGVSLPVLMFQVLHRLYHDADFAAQAYVAIVETDTSAGD